MTVQIKTEERLLPCVLTDEERRQKADQAAEALLNDGVEFLFGVMDEPTYLQKAEAAGVWTGYWNVDGRKFAPTKYVNNFDLSAWGGVYSLASLTITAKTSGKASDKTFTGITTDSVAQSADAVCSPPPPADMAGNQG